ncbi:MAG: sigma-54 dependent transcriptional regulator [Planctomycetota bacterium]
MDGLLLLIATDASLISQVQTACEDAAIDLEIVATPVDATLDAADVIVCSEDDFDHIRDQYLGASVLIYGQAADSQRAIESIKHGAFDYLLQPISPAMLTRRIQAARRVGQDTKRPAVYDAPTDSTADVDRIVGQSPAMHDVYKAIGRIAPRDINVLITGESGTGKELVARAILHHSPRRNAPYLAVNCAAIPETLLESELFGHEKGSFTGAHQQRIGKFEQCHGGTLFLDEIGDIPLSTQSKLLRVLQDQTFQRLGGSDVIRCDVRIIAATHQPLEDLIEQRAFRADLYYRLNVASIHVPPLREREVDVVLLAHFFVEKYNRDFATDIQAFAPETLPILLQYSWPGNVRELENVIQSTLVMAQGPILRPEFLPESIRRGSGVPTHATPEAHEEPRTARPVGPDAMQALASSWVAGSDAGERRFHAAVAAFEAELIRAALRESQGRFSAAAKHLGISRTTLRKKIDTYGIRITVD